MPNKEEYTPKMTQRLIGAEANKRMECAVFQISGKSCPETMTLSTMRFFPAHDGMKSALTMRENLPFLVKSVLRSKNLYRADCCVKRKPAWFRTEKGVFAVRLIKKRETSPALGALCVTVNTQNIERFLCAGKYCRRLALIDDKGLCVCTFGRGGEGSVFRKTNSVDGIGAAFPLCGVFSYLHL